MRPGQDIALEAIDWAQLVRPGDLVVWGQSTAEPTALTGSLLQAREAVGGFRAFIGISNGTSADPAYADHVAFSSYCGTGHNRKLGDRLNILPIHYCALASSLAREEPVVLLSLALGRDADHFSFGAGGDYIADLLTEARLVIAQVSPNTPRTGDGGDVPRSAIDLIVYTQSFPIEPEPARFGAVERQIAARVAEIIEDGSTLQIGLGATPAAVLRALAGHRNLGIHSGQIGDDVVDLVAAGVVTNARKTVDPGYSVVGLLSGGNHLMRWANGNDSLLVRPTSYTHNHAVLSSIDRFVAINSAIEVDLTGQVNAEVATGRYLGAVGGAVSFLRGACASRGGLPIIALPSVAGDRSRIVAKLSGPTTTARADVGFVVTEHGVADLRCLSLAQRRRRMLEIAHPCHAEALESALFA